MTVWEDAPKETQWEDAPSNQSSFKSGSAFDDTSKLIPSLDDIKKSWDTLKSQWENRHNTPMTEEDMRKMMAQEHAAGSAVLDTIGAIPSMVAGGVHGLIHGIGHGNMSEGLKTGMETMSNLLPSSLLGNKKDQQNLGYTAAMAPITAIADTLNAVPQGYGEILNALGAPNAAGQVTDTGKLAIMAGFGIKGAHDAAKLFKNTPDLKISDPRAEPTLEAPKPVVPDTPNPQYYEHGDLFAQNPYDVAGHVSEEHPSTIDNPQGDLFSHDLEIPQGEKYTPQQEAALTPKDLPDNPAMELAMKKAQEDAAYKQNESVKTAALDEVQQQQRAYEMRQREVETARLNGELDYQHSRDNLGDKSLMDPDSNAKMQDAVRQGDLKTAIDTIAQSHPDAIYRKLADYLGDKLDGIKTILHDDPVINVGDREYTGYFDPNTSTVGFSGLGASSPHTVLHETVHALTSQLIQARPNDLRVQALQGLFDKVRQVPQMAKDFPGIVNSREFISEAFSNPDFQKFLQNQKLDNRSMYQRFVDGVKNVFGLRPSIETPLTNALEHAIDLGKQLVEASDGPTRASLMDNFKQAGLSSKLADMMAQTPKDIQPSRDLVLPKVSGLEKFQKQFDFTPRDPKDVIADAKVAPDIPKSLIETIKANLDAGGMFTSLRHNNNPVIKATFSYIDAAEKSSQKLIRDNLTNPDNGLKTLLQKLNDEDRASTWAHMTLDEGQRERTPQELAQLNWNQDMINAQQRHRELDTKLLAETNAVRASMNPPLAPIDPRMAHLAGRFTGDFTHMVFEEVHNANGTVTRNPVMRVGENTARAAQKLADHIQAEHPDWIVEKQEYNKIKVAMDNTDRFNGFRELMNYVGKNDPLVAKALDTLDKYNRRVATNYLAVTNHALDKKTAPGGLQGSEGNKSWLDMNANAEQGFKAQLEYMATSYKWLEMQKAMDKVSKIVTDPEVIEKQKNAIEWSIAYTDHALNKNQGFMAEFANNFLSAVGEVTGIGHTNLMRGVNNTGSGVKRLWMGLFNIPFTMKHLLLPLQKMPAMLAYIKTIGDINGSMLSAGAHSLDSYYKYLSKESVVSPFQEAAFRHAQDNNIFKVDLSNTNGRVNASKAMRIASKAMDLDFAGPEHLIRGTSFFFYAHLLESSGMEPKAALSAAEHLTQFLYTDYRDHEAPRVVSKGGWVSQLALQVTRYKANEISELGFFNRARESDPSATAVQKIANNAPLATHLAAHLAWSGIMGMMAFTEADQLYRMFSKYFMKEPDNLFAVLQRSKAADYVKYGLFGAAGLDPKISEAQLVPHPFPTTAAELTILEHTWELAKFPDTFHAKQLALAFTPASIRGPNENMNFTGPKETSGPHAGRSMYENPSTGRGRYARTDNQMMIRNFGYHTTDEMNEVNDNYSKSLISKDHADLADHIKEKAQGLLASGVSPQEVGQQLGKEYTKHQQMGQPDFASILDSYMEAQHMTQKEQMLIRASRDKTGNTLSIFKGK